MVLKPNTRLRGIAMRVALCLHGLVGNILGKSGDKELDGVGSDIVLDLAGLHWNKYIIEPNNVDVFIHSWSRDLKKRVRKVFFPTTYRAQDQIRFDIPDNIYMKYANTSLAGDFSDDNPEVARIRNHYSKWFSLQKSVDFALDFSSANNFKYDCIMASRIDAAPKKKIIFKDHDMNCFWKVGGPVWDRSRFKMQDVCFFSNQDMMKEFSRLYQNMSRYLSIGNFSSVRISNHRLAKLHMNNTVDKYIKESGATSGFEKDVELEVLREAFLRSYRAGFKASKGQGMSKKAMNSIRKAALKDMIKIRNYCIRNAFIESERDNPNKSECPIIRQLYFGYTRRGPGTFHEDAEGRLVNIDEFVKKYNIKN